MLSSPKRLTLLTKLADHTTKLESIEENHIIANLYTQMYVFLLMVNDDSDLIYEDVLDVFMYDPGIVRIARVWSMHSPEPLSRFKRWVLDYVTRHKIKLTDVVYIFPDVKKSYFSPKHASLLTIKDIKDITPDRKVYFEIYVDSMEEFRRISSKK